MDLTYDAAGSYKTANDVWRGGVMFGSLGEANKRTEERIDDDCRGWGRYIHRPRLSRCLQEADDRG